MDTLSESTKQVPETLICRCPDCNRKIHVPMFRHATDIRYRTCRGCGE